MRPFGLKEIFEISELFKNLILFTIIRVYNRLPFDK